MKTKRIIISFIFILFTLKVLANTGEKDSLFVEIKDGRLMAIHTVKKNENLYSIAQKYTVPALVLSQNNDVSFYESLAPDRKLWIPLGKYNYLKTKPEDASAYKALYINLRGNETYKILAASIEVPEDIIRNWNQGLELSALPQKVAFMGWALCQSSEASPTNEPTPSSATKTTVTTIVRPIEKKDTAKGPPSELELVYRHQTSNGQFVDSLDGMVVFFKPQTTVNQKLLYAFSNEIAKGRVVKIVNPSNNKYVYAKIIGNLPATKQYLNAKIGLDGRARTELDTREIKLWCTFFLKY